jgi:hypothetical protein
VVAEDITIASKDEIWRFFFLSDGERGGVKIEETVIVLDSKLRFYFNPLK